MGGNETHTESDLETFEEGLSLASLSSIGRVSNWKCVPFAQILSASHSIPAFIATRALDFSRCRRVGELPVLSRRHIAAETMVGPRSSVDATRTFATFAFRSHQDIGMGAVFGESGDKQTPWLLP